MNIRLILKKNIVLVGIISIGIIIRSAHLFFINPFLPAHSGGLFLSFAEGITLSGYSLPSFIPFYSEGGIPYAYPPLPFYIIAILIELLDISGYFVINVLPVIVSILTIPIVYLVAKEVSMNRFISTLIVAIFSFMPSAFQQQIEDEGIAEAFGTLAFFVLIYQIHRTYKNNNLSNYFLLGLAGIFCLVTSPGSAYAAAIVLTLFALFVIFTKPNKKLNLQYLIIAALTTIIGSSFYWMPVIDNHGTAIFTHSIASQHSSSGERLTDFKETILTFNVSHAKFAFYWNAVIVLGVISTFFTGKFYMTIILFILFFIPRETAWLVSIPGSILGGYGLKRIFDIVTKKNNHLFQPIILGFLIFLLSIYASYNAMYAIRHVKNWSRPERARLTIDAGKWIQQNSPQDIVVMIVDSHLREWTPRLMARTVLNVPQGTEWKPDTAIAIKKNNDYIRGCVDHACIFRAAQTYFEKDSFLVFTDKITSWEFLMENSQTTDYSYKVLYTNKPILIGEFSRPSQLK